MNRLAKPALLLAALGAITPGHAGLTAYPISGRWASTHTQERPDCNRPPFMEFRGDRRFDFGNSSVPEYRVLSIVPTGNTAFRIVEIFFNGQIQGRMTYTLQVRDADHASMHLQPDGRFIALARCT